MTGPVAPLQNSCIADATPTHSRHHQPRHLPSHDPDSHDHDGHLLHSGHAHAHDREAALPHAWGEHHAHFPAHERVEDRKAGTGSPASGAQGGLEGRQCGANAPLPASGSGAAGLHAFADLDSFTQMHLQLRHLQTQHARLSERAERAEQEAAARAVQAAAAVAATAELQRQLRQAREMAMRESSRVDATDMQLAIASKRAEDSAAAATEWRLRCASESKRAAAAEEAVAALRSEVSSLRENLPGGSRRREAAGAPAEIRAPVAGPPGEPIRAESASCMPSIHINDGPRSVRAEAGGVPGRTSAAAMCLASLVEASGGRAAAALVATAPPPRPAAAAPSPSVCTRPPLTELEDLLPSAPPHLSLATTKAGACPQAAPSQLDDPQLHMAVQPQRSPSASAAALVPPLPPGRLRLPPPPSCVLAPAPVATRQGSQLSSIAAVEPEALAGLSPVLATHVGTPQARGPAPAPAMTPAGAATQEVSVKRPARAPATCMNSAPAADPGRDAGPAQESPVTPTIPEAAAPPPPGQAEQLPAMRPACAAPQTLPPAPAEPLAKAPARRPPADTLSVPQSPAAPQSAGDAVEHRTPADRPTSPVATPPASRPRSPPKGTRIRVKPRSAMGNLPAGRPASNEAAPMRSESSGVAVEAPLLADSGLAQPRPSQSPVSPPQVC